MMRGKVTAVDARGVFVQTADYGVLGPLPWTNSPPAVGGSVLVADAGQPGQPDLIVLGTVPGEPADRLPTGAVTPFAGSSAPTGWLLCAGQAVSQTTYAGLYALLGTAYNTGGEGTGNFRLPDLRGRTVAGLDNMGGSDAGRLDWANTLGTSGGAQTHTLSTPEIPAHSHRPYGVGYAQMGGADVNRYTAASGGSLISGVSESVGGGGAHNNMQPTMLLNWIIRT